MCKKNNMMILKKKSKIKKLKQFKEGFSLFIKQCYHIVWNLETIQKKKTKNFKNKKRKNNAFIKMCSVW